MNQRTTDTIIADLKKIVQERKPLDRSKWLEAAFYLSVLREDQANKLNGLNQAVSKIKLAILEKQEGKKNVSLAEDTVECTDEYLAAKNQEAKIYTVDELIRVAKRNAETTF